MENDSIELVFDGEEFSIPVSLLEDRDVFDKVVSLETWSNELTNDDRDQLLKQLPQDLSKEEKEKTIRMLFDKDEFAFGNPIDQAWDKLSSGCMCSDAKPLYDELRKLKYEHYKQSIKRHHIKLLEELLLSRRRLIQSALESGSLDSMATMVEKKDSRPRRKRHSKKEMIADKVEDKYRKILRDCRVECDLSPDCDSSDDEERLATPTTNKITEAEYYQMLKEHKKKRKMKTNRNGKIIPPELDTRGVSMGTIMGPTCAPTPQQQSGNHDNSHTKDKQLSSIPHTESVSKKSTVTSSSSVSMPLRRSSHLAQEAKKKDKQLWEGLFHGKGCIYEAYKDQSKLKVEKADPIMLAEIQGPLPVGRYTSFFAVLKKVFESLNDHKGDVAKVTEVTQIFLDTPECQSCEWLSDQPSWTDHVLSALCYLGAEVGGYYNRKSEEKFQSLSLFYNVLAVSTFDPLPHFYPVVEFKDRIDHWKWAGNKRDSDIELLVLCNHWKENLNRSLTVVDYTDYSPVPSLVPSSSIVRSSKSYEVERFQLLEIERYSNPQKAFTYLVHGYEAAVGPVKGVKGGGGGSTKKEQGSRAREHFLLKSERPNCVTILSLVRDACSRLPNGEGTRLDICILLKDSQFIADNVTDSQLNNAVSGALDRLHYEKDPCVRYISSKKMWIYLHRNRSEEEFEHISWACEAANKNRKVIMSRAKLSPKILLKDPSTGCTVDISPTPGTIPAPSYGKTKASPKVSRSPKTSSAAAQKSSGKATKSTKGSTGKKSGGKKPYMATSPAGLLIPPAPPPILPPTSPFISSGHGMSSESVLTPSMSDQVSDHSGAGMEADYVKKFSFSRGGSPGGVAKWAPPPTGDDSDSFMSE